MEFNFIEVMTLILIVFLFSAVIKLTGQVKGLQYMLNQMYNQTGIPIDHELKQLIHAGKDVKAVKVVRDTLGLSLIEAKQYIDALKMERK